MGIFVFETIKIINVFIQGIIENKKHRRYFFC